MCIQSYRWRSVWRVPHLTTFPYAYIKTVSVDV
jgi:hypothetical protein